MDSNTSFDKETKDDKVSEESYDYVHSIAVIQENGNGTVKHDEVNRKTIEMRKSNSDKLTFDVWKSEEMSPLSLRSGTSSKVSKKSLDYYDLTNISPRKKLCAELGEPVPSSKKLLGENDMEKSVFEEEDYVKQLQIKSSLNPNDVDLYREGQMSERKFHQSLCVLIQRDKGVSWKGWLNGYIQLVELSPKGTEYLKTNRTFLIFEVTFYLCINTICTDMFSFVIMQVEKISK